MRVSPIEPGPSLTSAWTDSAGEGQVARERLERDAGLANPAYRPPPDPCVLPKAMLVVERAKDVSQPDN
jgi:hypothetical protein